MSERVLFKRYLTACARAAPERKPLSSAAVTSANWGSISPRWRRFPPPRPSESRLSLESFEKRFDMPLNDFVTAAAGLVALVPSYIQEIRRLLQDLDWQVEVSSGAIYSRTYARSSSIA